MSEQCRARPELTCRELVELVTDYIENALPPEEQAQVVEHLAGCKGCDRYLVQMRDTIAVLGTLKVDQVSPRAEETLREVFREWKNESRE